MIVGAWIAFVAVILLSIVTTYDGGQAAVKGNTARVVWESLWLLIYLNAARWLFSYISGYMGWF